MTVKTNTARSKVLEICERSLRWAQERHYTGYSKFDALNSPLLSLIANRSYYVRAGFTFGLSRMPINIRPFLLVKKKQNPKGLSLFARAHFNMWHNTHEKNSGKKDYELLICFWVFRSASTIPVIAGATTIRGRIRSSLSRLTNQTRSLRSTEERFFCKHTT